MAKPKASISVQQFFQRFPDDDACLEHLFQVRFGSDYGCPRCGEIGKFRRLRKMPAYTCNCGHHIHPMQGTPFALTRTSLQKWFYAMYLFTTTRHGVSAKELQRQLSVTYKTAWRMGHEIRKYMGWVDDDAPLGGRRKIVEVDEVRIGGKDKRGEDDKTVVLGMVERKGEIITRVVPNVRETTLVPHIKEHVRPGSPIATDEHGAYRGLHEEGYNHASVNHSAKEYVRGLVHTNTIEGFWRHLKHSIRGTHIFVSEKHLHKYLGEFEFRFNLRDRPELMFDLLLLAFPRAAQDRSDG